jgi:hypothetical protein
MEEEQSKIQNEISELEQLINKAEQSRDDPEAAIAANIFHELIRVRTEKLCVLGCCASKIYN